MHLRAPATQRLRILALALLPVLLLVVSPSSTVGGHPSTPAQPGPPAAASIAPGPRPAPATGSTPGLDPRAESPVSSMFSLSRTVRDRALGAVNLSTPGAGAPAPARGPPPDQGTNGSWFTGTIANSSDPADLISGVFVTALPVGLTAPCTYQACGPPVTSSTGAFNVSCAPGNDYVYASTAYFAQNYTFADCLAGQTVAVGTILLVPDGYVTGVLLGDVPGHPPAGGITLTGETRSASDIAPSAGSNLTTGVFRLAVPPQLASQIEIAGGGANDYLPNQTWVTVASGSTLDIGTVFVEPGDGAEVQAEFFNAVTGAEIDAANGSNISLQLCPLIAANGTDFCEGEALLGPGPWAESGGPSGQDYVIAMASGYVTNTTPVGYVPPGVNGTPTCVPASCRIDLVPLGEISGEVALSGDGGQLFDGGALGSGTLDLVDRSLAGYWTAAACIQVQYCGPKGTEEMAFAVPIGAPFEVPALPLWNVVNTCGGGWDPDDCNALMPSFPAAPWDLTLVGNTTTLNVTPDEVTSAGFLNSTPGTYVEGQVFLAGTDLPVPSGWSVTDQSRVEPSLEWSGLVGTQSASDPCPTSGPTYFCVPAPPGPSEIQVTDPGYRTNETWVDVPYKVCCVRSAAAPGSIGPFLLSNVTAPADDAVNLTPIAFATVDGAVVMAGTTTPVAGAGIEICPATAAATVGCEYGVANATGWYSVPGVPEGWVNVLAAAPSVASNSEWVDAVGTTTAPTIPLQPFGILTGRVLVSGGAPAIGAAVTVCAIDTLVPAPSCIIPLGAGETNSFGEYLGPVAGGWLPLATYEVTAEAPGYAPEFVWGNATVGGTTVLPTMVLQPVGTVERPLSAAGRSSANAPGTTWVDGRLLDPSTGRGVGGATFVPCPVTAGLSCSGTIAGYSDAGGFFNFSVAAGIYNVSVAARGYQPLDVLVNATVPPAVNVGTIDLAGIDWVWGNVTLNPWPRITVWLSPTDAVPIVLAPDASVAICAVTGLGCADGYYGGTGLNPVGTGGAFETPSFLGQFLGVEASAPIFDFTVVSVNVTSGEHGLPPAAWPHMPMWSEVSGTVWNNASANGSGGFGDPASWAFVTESNVIPVPNGGLTGLPTPQANSGLPGWYASMGGEFASLIPSGGSTRTADISVADPDQFFPGIVPIDALLGPGQNLTYVAPPIGLLGYGWAEASLVSATTGLPITEAVGVAATYYDPSVSLFGSTTGMSNAAGFVNLSAPAGSAVLFTFQATTAYNGSSLYASVTAGQTTVLTASSSNGSGTLPIELNPAGYLASASINYSAPSGYNGTLYDPVANESIPYALAVASSSDPTIGSDASLPSNDLGEFFTLAPIGPSDRVSVSRPGFESAQSLPSRVTPGNITSVGVIDLVGKGVVAGQVVSVPGLLPVPGATVTACPTGANQTLCESFLANESGDYWVLGNPGPVTLSVSAPGMVANATVTVNVRSDAWEAGPTLELLGDSEVEGTVWGLPTATPIGGATVSLCSPLGTPTGPCDYSVPTPSSGAFVLYAVPGTFVLVVSAPGYNTTYTTLGIPGGTVVNLANIFLQAYGTVAGTVVDAATADPIAGASLSACTLGPGAICSSGVLTNAAGDYALTVPPGSVTVLATAPGFEPADERVAVRSGGNVTAPEIQMTPVAGAGPFTVSGRVVEAQDATIGIADAAVTFLVGATRAASTDTGPGGEFSASVFGGQYLLTVSASGFQSSSRSLEVAGNLSGVDLSLSVWQWNVTVLVADGLTGAPIARAAVVFGPTDMGTTGPLGVFATQLPNGSYVAQVSDYNPGGESDLAVSLNLVVNDGPASAQVDLYPPVGQLNGSVVAQGSGAPLSQAEVAVRGSAIDGAAVVDTAHADSAGTFALTLYLGSYTVTVSAPGYAASSEQVVITGGNAPIRCVLRPLPTVSSPAGSSIPAEWALLTGIALLLAAAGVAVWGWYRRRPPRAPPVPDPPPVEYLWTPRSPPARPPSGEG